MKYFLEQCLLAVRRSSASLSVQTIVIDNCSTDGSLEYLQPLFPEVYFERSPSNVGFARACNRGLQLAQGTYVLFLNPDTIVSEESFRHCLQFFETHPDCGALGVQMVDGSGHFLKESKRSFPSPLTSLFKLFGLSYLFPRSRVFGRYHLGHLSREKDHEVDVLAGAYMMMRRSLLETLGGFDETFFMYGEDVDLSYRVQKAGYKNYYLAGTTIIHFKGESTKRGSLNYIRMFYQAMSIFVRKHYGGARAGLFNASIHFAIWMRAGMAAATKLVQRVGLPVMDALLILGAFWLMKEFWVAYVRTDLRFEEKVLLFAFPAFTILYLAVAYYAGLYDRYYRMRNLFRSTAIATLVLLAAYALLPESLRFSRGVLLFGAGLAFVLISLLRTVLIKTKILSEAATAINRPHLLIVGSESDYLVAHRFLSQQGLKEAVIGRVGEGNGVGFVTGREGLAEAARSLNAREIIFCTASASYHSIIEEVKQLQGKWKIRFFSGHSIIGSDDQTTQGEILAPESTARLALPANRRTKRLLDVVSALCLLVLFPLSFFVYRKPGGLLKNALLVLSGRKTWVGYLRPVAALPPLRPSVLGPNGPGSQGQQALREESLQMADHWYARDYEPLHDLATIFKSARFLGG